MPQRLHRYYSSGHLHFITSSCYRRRPLLRTPRRRSLFLKILEQTRLRYSFVVVGYVVMPEHIHLLISEPDRGTPSTVMQVLKQRFARRVLGDLRRRKDGPQGSLWQEALDSGHVWQRRFYDFVVRTEIKKIEKLKYIHRNPVRRRLVLEPEQVFDITMAWAHVAISSLLSIGARRLPRLATPLPNTILACATCTVKGFLRTPD